MIASYNESILKYKKENRNQSPIVLFLDIKAAYDSVDHNILLTKLKGKELNPYMS